VGLSCEKRGSSGIKRIIKPVEWILLVSTFFLAMPLTGYIKGTIGLPYLLAVPICVVVLVGIALLFYQRIITVDKIFIAIISIKLLKEFIFVVLTLYGLLITTFASFYYLIALADGLNVSYLKWFYFSVITLTSVGYGDIVPINSTMMLLVSLESFLGYISPSIIFTIGLGLILKENRL
jgi:voltage-gated potassium channel Kch